MSNELTTEIEPARAASPKAAPGSFEIRVLRSVAEIEGIRASWTAMQWNPELDIDFVSFIVNTRPEIVRPLVIAVYQRNRPIALLAGRIENGFFEVKLGYKVLWRQKVRKLGIFYGGLMGQSDATVIKLVLKQLMRSLREEKADLFYWNGVRSGTELQKFVRQSPGLLNRDYLSRSVQHWAMSLPGSLEELLEKRMNKKHRYWAKRTMRLLEKDFPGAVKFACYAEPEEMEKLFTDVILVAKKTYQWALGVGFRDNEEQKKRLLLEAGKGWLRGYVLYVKNQPVAFWISLVYQDTAHSAYTGYDPVYQKYEVGTALFLHMVGDLCREQVKQLDFGLGSALYKERFGDSNFEETTYVVFASGGRGMLLNSLRLATEGPIELARIALKRLGLEQKLKKIWRRRAVKAQATKEPAAEAE